MPLYGEIFALITSFLWAGTAVVFSEASKLVGSHFVNVTRLLLAVIFLSITIFLFGLHKGIDLNFNQVFFLSLSGFVGLTLGDTFLFKALEIIGPRLSMLLMSMAPPIAAVLSFIFLGENISIIGWMGIIISTSGVALVTFVDKNKNEKFTVNLFGLAMGILAALGQAGGLILAKKGLLAGDINEFLASFIRMISGFSFLFPILIFTKKIKFSTQNSLSSKALILIFIGSIIGPYLGITFSVYAIANANVGIASTLMSLSPIILIPISKFMYNDNISYLSISGTFLAIVGVAMIFLRDAL